MQSCQSSRDISYIKHYYIFYILSIIQMSDKYYLLSYYVKICQTCLSRMSIIVILCQTCLTRVVAQDVEISIWWSWEALFVEDITTTDSSDTWNSIDIMSDKSWQPESPPVADSDTQSSINQSDTMISPDAELWSKTDAVSNLSGDMVWSWSSDTAGEVLIIGSAQATIWQWTIEQNLSEIPYLSDWDEPQLRIASFALMTSFVLPNPSPQLSITEVRIDGTDEYIEITNRWDPFSWSITISGSKSSLLTVWLNLWTNESAVIGDTLAMVISSWFDIVSGQWLSMTDTTIRSLQLIYSGDVIDSLNLTTIQVVWSDNQSAAREYDFLQQIWQVTPTSHNANIISWHRGNPWVVWWLSLFPPSTWSVTTWSVTTWIILTGVVLTWTINIVQVYPFADCVGEHLALSFSTPYSWSLSIAGLGTSDSIKTFSIVVPEPWVRYIVESSSGILSDNVVVVPGITLTDGGESLILTDALSWNIFDSIIYSATQATKASSFTSLSWDTRLFSTHQAPAILSSCNQSVQLPQIGWCRISAVNEWYDTGSFSAGFTVSGSLVDSACGSSSRLVDWVTSTTNSCSLWQSFAPWSHRVIYQQYSWSTLICEDEYMFYGAIHQQTLTNTITVQVPVVQEQYTCAIISQNKTAFRLGTSINVIASLNNQELTNASSYQCQRSWLIFNGMDTCNPGFFQISQAVLATLQLTISSSTGHELCQTQSIFNYPSGWSSSASQSSYYHDLYTKWKERYDRLQDSVQGQWFAISGDKIVDPQESLKAPSQLPRWTILQISQVIADGPGNDRDGTESVSVTSLLSSWVDLRWATLVVNNKVVYSFTGELSGWATTTVYDYFPLPNDGWCVALINLSWLYDQVCYGSYGASDVRQAVSGSVWSIILPSLLDPKSCLKLEEYALLELDIREQKLINKAQKQNYQAAVTRSIAYYRERSDELYHTYRSITDSKQAYIESQKTYIAKLQWQVQKSYDYGTRITQLYNSSKAYNTTISERNSQCQDDQRYIQQNYPAIYRDPQLETTTDLPPLSSFQQSEEIIEDSQTRRSAASETISNLF